MDLVRWLLNNEPIVNVLGINLYPALVAFLAALFFIAFFVFALTFTEPDPKAARKKRGAISDGFLSQKNAVNAGVATVEVEKYSGFGVSDARRLLEQGKYATLGLYVLMPIALLASIALGFMAFVAAVGAAQAPAPDYSTWDLLLDIGQLSGGELLFLAVLVIFVLLIGLAPTLIILFALFTEPEPD